jgi:hypothetical protein
MTESKYSAKEIVERGEEIYQQQIRKQVESEHHGEFLVLDILAGEYEIDSEDFTATRRLMARCPDAVIYGLRIGHRAAYHLGVSKVSH